MKISIKVKKDVNMAKDIIAIRKITGKSILVIKSSIENVASVFECILFRNDDCKEKVETLIKELLNLGDNLRIIGENEEIQVNYLLNRFREISKETQELDDLMYGEY